MAGVSMDTESSIYCPGSDEEWTTTIAAVGAGANPAYLWLCQEEVGNLEPTIGAVSLVADNTPTYQNAETGWTRRSVGGTASNAQFTGTLANPATTSLMFMAYVTLIDGAARTPFLGEHDNSGPRVDLEPGGQIRLNAGGNLAVTAAAATLNAMTPVIVQYDRTNTETVLYLLGEKLTATYAAATGALFRMITARAGGAGAVCRVSYLCEWSGAGAELTPAQVKTLLETLGWEPTFTP